MSWRRRATNPSIGARLLSAQTLVMTATIGTAAGVAAVIGPPLFHAHMLEAGHSENSSELEHIEMAYREASLLALAVAVTVALTCSLIVSWYLARRIQQPLSNLAEAAADVAGGHYEVRLSAAGAGPELDAVTGSFNLMARRLEDIEDTRRRLLADLGHEMRTPISTIRAYLESLEDGVRDWDEETRRVLHGQVDRLTLLATDITAVSAAEEGNTRLEIQRIEVGGLMRAAADAAQNAYRSRGVDLNLELPALPGVVRGDPNRLGQVFSNLLDNALQHSPTGSRVTVGSRAQGGKVHFTVTDYGDGIPAAQLPHVFERFYRGDAARDRRNGGSGIGLTISRAIVEAHGGSISAASPGPGHGTVMEFSLPLL